MYSGSHSIWLSILQAVEPCISERAAGPISAHLYWDWKREARETYGDPQEPGSDRLVQVHAPPVLLRTGSSDKPRSQSEALGNSKQFSIGLNIC